MSINGLIGTWAGPARARHRLRDGAPLDRRRRRRDARLVGRARGRHGRGRRGARAERALASAPRSARTPASRRSLIRERPRRRRRARGRRGAPRADRRHGVPPADHVPAPDRPRRAARGLRPRHRALVEPLGRREDQPRGQQAARCSPAEPEWTDFSGGFEIAPSIDAARALVRGGAGRAGRHVPVQRRRDPDDARPVARAAEGRTSSRCSRSGSRTRGRRSRTGTSSRPTPTA